ncbi:MAG TPA: DUF3280 domain-containing protein [Acetobacteraceae bacterium]
MKLWRPATFALVLALGYTQAAPCAPLQAAVFPFAFDDTSLEPPQPAELARLHKIDAELRELLAKSGKYTIIDITSIEAKANESDLVSCQACAVSLAKQLGAQVAVIAWVQKVSNLILNINAVIRSTATGDMVSAGSVDIRGNTDESWSRGVSYLVANRLLKKNP